MTESSFNSINTNTNTGYAQFDGTKVNSSAVTIGVMLLILTLEESTWHTWHHSISASEASHPESSCIAVFTLILFYVSLSPRLAQKRLY